MGLSRSCQDHDGSKRLCSSQEYHHGINVGFVGRQALPTLHVLVNSKSTPNGVQILIIQQTPQKTPPTVIFMKVGGLFLSLSSVRLNECV